MSILRLRRLHFLGHVCEEELIIGSNMVFENVRLVGLLDNFL